MLTLYSLTIKGKENSKLWIKRRRERQKSKLKNDELVENLNLRYCTESVYGVTLAKVADLYYRTVLI